MTRIDDPEDPRIELFLGLRDQAAQQRREQPGGDRAGNFIAEGVTVIERGIEAGYVLASVLCDANRADRLSATIISAAPVYLGSDPVLTAVSGRPELRDPIACFVRPPLPNAIDLIAAHRSFAILEGLNNPNNLGVIMRNAAGLGIGAVLLDPTCADPLYRRAIRASMGQVFAVPHARIGPIADNRDLFANSGVHTVALTPTGDTALSELSIPSDRKLGVLLGAEGPGLTESALAMADVRCRIEMERSVDSLNVANAAAIAFWAVRST